MIFTNSWIARQIQDKGNNAAQETDMEFAQLQTNDEDYKDTVRYIYWNPLFKFIHGKEFIMRFD